MEQPSVCPRVLWKERPHMVWEDGEVRPLESSDIVPAGRYCGQVVRADGSEDATPPPDSY